MIDRVVVGVAVALLAGCASISTSPRVTGGATGTTAVQGALDFDGNRDFLPAPLLALPPAEPGSTRVFRYRYDVHYDDTDLSALALFNPLTILGCPTGSVSVVTDATLEVTSSGDTVRRYAARTVASRLRTIYSGDPLSELRSRALRASAQSIAEQLAADGDVTASAQTRAAPTIDGGNR